MRLAGTAGASERQGAPSCSMGIALGGTGIDHTLTTPLAIPRVKRAGTATARWWSRRRITSARRSRGPAIAPAPPGGTPANVGVPEGSAPAGTPAQREGIQPSAEQASFAFSAVRGMRVAPRRPHDGERALKVIRTVRWLSVHAPTPKQKRHGTPTLRGPGHAQPLMPCRKLAQHSSGLPARCRPNRP
jgi:hypothetical protein